MIMIRIAVVAAFLAALAIAGYAALETAYRRGRAAERGETLARAIALVKERDKLNVEIRTATAGDICRRLGGVWLPDEDACG